MAVRQVALVTGGSRGIGRACARALCRDGFSVVILYEKNKEAADETVRLCHAEGGDCAAYACDIGNAEAIEAAVQQILKLYHRVDALVLNAAISHIGLLTDMTDDEWQRMMDVNLTSAFRLCRRLLPGMVSRGSGSVVMLTSMWGEVGASCEAAYSAAKAGLIGLMKALAKEVGPSGVRVNCVSPGVIDTDMNRHLGEETLAELAEETPLGRLGTAEDVAQSVAFLTSPAASFITGQVLGVSGGYCI